VVVRRADVVSVVTGGLVPVVLTQAVTGSQRPAVIVQADALNCSTLSTTVCVPLTSNLRWADALGNVLLPKRSTGLDRDSVANVSLVTAIDVSLAIERTGRLSRQRLSAVLDGIETVLGR
jgi:mRNA interferase MazF